MIKLLVFGPYYFPSYIPHHTRVHVRKTEQYLFSVNKEFPVSDRIHVTTFSEYKDFYHPVYYFTTLT